MMMTRHRIKVSVRVGRLPEHTHSSGPQQVLRLLLSRCAEQVVAVVAVPEVAVVAVAVVSAAMMRSAAAPVLPGQQQL